MTDGGDAGASPETGNTDAGGPYLGGVGWAPLIGSDVAPAVAPPLSGWYPDPWTTGHHRYWNGADWTGDSFPSALPGSTPAAGVVVGSADPATHSLPRVTPPPPEWSSAGSGQPWAAPPLAPPVPAPLAGHPDQPRPPNRLAFVAGLLAVMLVVGSLAVLGGYLWAGHRSSSRPEAARVVPQVPFPTFPTLPLPTLPTVPAPPADAAASVLPGLVVTAADVAPTMLVQPLFHGDQVAGQPTLDLCNGIFPSESLRTARLQVQAFDEQLNGFLSTEAVLYPTPDATAQAFSELRAVAAACPDSPVDSPVGETTITTHFNAAPDAAWPQVATVERLAYDYTATDDLGSAHHSVAVYLRRGRVLMGVYFAQPDGPQPSVAGQTTIAGITNVFAGRMAALPASIAGG